MNQQTAGSKTDVILELVFKNQPGIFGTADFSSSSEAAGLAQNIALFRKVLYTELLKQEI